MKRAAIVSPVRTPVGTFGGSLRSVPVEELGALVTQEVLKRTGLDPKRIDDVVFAQSYANSETPCVGRWIALQAGLPVEVPGMQLDRRCGGGLQALATAAMMVQTGAADVVLAGGVESMSNIEYYSTDMRWGARAGSVQFHDRLARGRERSQPEARFGHISGMIETAENLANDFHISREAADEYAVRSHRRAAQAWASGRMAAETVAVAVPQKKGAPLAFAQDEGFREDASMESLGKLRALIPGGTVTAGNSSQQNDAAAACLVVAEDKLEALGLEPMAYLNGWAAAGCEPSRMGIGPVPAVQKLMARTGLSIDQMDLVELNEAFACQVLAVLKGWGWNDPERLNVNGSGISLGHPIGATGVRMMTTLLFELQRRKGRYGLEAMCIGGGQGLAAIFERA
ncbi:acetyl-CoA C-acetyltransferase [Paraburkholderia madseniana]|uniref:Acetyl-CoA C-acetyltransferase n=1 Tax=Paraburkholderia madseniana TaxID=2599607 RepID=A0AAP5BE44_9BURK|nr:MULTISPECIES: acetyl-CoA C-acetyltransferase [Paraburkholderia]MCX4147826.1 acetyl-CoA C-acetyltransferase [Paraburkholderia madseniana]MDN7150768.1 acetyl-CoA C-acetyltransferase [Paraburkholderia sp. WS6]MDQ6409648.1 acetyl-CoA C-acetyltransferase [Paraburkholderia madseniana]